MTLIEVSRELRRRVDRLEFKEPVTHVYDPLDYAQEPHERYLSRWGTGRKEAVFVGMNPGPFGMAQTGVPFGDPALVRGFVGVEGRVRRPKRVHPKRPVDGFACGRSEVSGTRFWGWARERFGVPERFFERFFVVNWCPLAFMEESGRNRTPDKLPREEREPLEAACDDALREAIALLDPRWVIGIGAFAEKRCRIALDGVGARVGSILHPSPASPKANGGWAKIAERELVELGLSL